MPPKQSHAIGIDLGTTYSCIAWLNEHGQPVTLANQEGELATPSVVFLDHGEFVVGTEALRNSIAHPDRVVQNAKRSIGDTSRNWKIDNTTLTPEFVSAQILRKLLSAATTQVGEVSEAVITVPAQFSDAQRHATIQAGHAAGLEKVEIINEPVAAALCHVLGREGLAFTELAVDQRLMIFDLGGGTLDLSIVNYTNDHVRVIASDGDLELGGLDWTQVLIDTAADRFQKEFREDPREDPESHQALTLEAEQAKRSLSVRPRAAITVQHAGHRQTYQIEQKEFEVLSRKLVKRTEAITRRILKNNNMGWAHIDGLLITGGATRMPMIRESLQSLSGRTLNSVLSPDQSIAHGAAYYAGMLLTNSNYARTVFSSQASARLAKVRQQSVNARSLGILLRNPETKQHFAHYLIPANTALPASKTHTFGTVVDNQTNVCVRIVESGTSPDKAWVELAECRISDLPVGLPADSKVDVTISYDAQARVHVRARELSSQMSAEVQLIRQENMSAQLQETNGAAGGKSIRPAPAPPRKSKPSRPTESRKPQPVAPSPRSSPDRSAKQPAPQLDLDADSLETLAALSDAPPAGSDSGSGPFVIRCMECSQPLNRDGECDTCISNSQALRNWVKSQQEMQAQVDPELSHTLDTPLEDQSRSARRKPRKGTSSPEEEFWNLVDEG